jgi:hypothetical protein
VLSAGFVDTASTEVIDAGDAVRFRPPAVSSKRAGRPKLFAARAASR